MSCIMQIISRRVHAELHGRGFHDQADAAKLYITKSSQSTECSAVKHNTTGLS